MREKAASCGTIRLSVKADMGKAAHSAMHG
ncbi:hypothetical protein J2S20_000733 [Moryella indoligenes]|uniref:Uncharacterized protein n=1 Tax=Moryella indoligenes TaxID=371674 RepID=A0AAE4ALC7_9FIRM|nr:hypothetical protein [Moryella indoligenes]